MSRFLKPRKKRKGLPPGSLVYLGESKNVPVEMTLISYSSDFVDERRVIDLHEAAKLATNPKNVSWLNITGSVEKSIMVDVGERFGIHSLWLEDVLNTDHRPKVEELDNLIFVIVKLPKLEDKKSGKVSFEQISIFLGEGFVISFQEHPADTFSSIKERIQKGLGNVRSAQADYLFYALIDRVIDDYYEAVETLGAQVEKLDAQLREELDNFDSNKIIELRNEFLFLRKSAVPIRDSLKSILSSKKDEIQQSTKRYFRDAYDHSIHIVETIDGYRELLKGQVDAYQNMLNQRMNEVIKVLTVFATIFTPLTFIAGVYGMNFKYMPELKWSGGYFFSLGLMLVVALALLYYFKRKRWL